MRRRRFLRHGALGTIAGSSVFSGSCTSWADSGGPDAPRSAAAGSRSDFLWMHGRFLDDTKIRENLLAFASRHDLPVVLRVDVPGEDRSAADVLGEPLTAAREFGVTTWLAAGVLRHLTAEEFVRDAEKRRRHERRLSELVRVYRERSDGGRVILWEEAPIAGRWTPDGKWTDRAARNLRNYGATVFEAQRRTVEDVDPEIETGIFVHFTYIVDSKNPQVFANLMDDLRDRGALPDFAFVDFYRGNYEKDVGLTETNRTVRSLVTNARAHTGGREVLYLASAHTIKPRYTVSKQSMRMDLRAARAAAADGIGWYASSRYRQTEQGFDAYVPNTAPPESVVGEDVGTFTVARDRWLYGYASTLGTDQGYDPASKFDLWIRGTDLGFHDHRVAARTVDGEWAFLGDVAGYRDGEYPYGTAGRDHVAIFHALDRERFGTADGLDLRFESASGGGSSELTGAWLLPFDPRAYVAEHEARRIVDDRGVSDFAFGEWSGPVALHPGEATAVSIPASTDASPRALESLTLPRNADVVRRLREFESADGFDPAAAFDLWVRGSDLSRNGTPAVDLRVVSEGSTRSVERNSVTAAAIDDGIVFYGLPREGFFERVAGESVEVRRKTEAASVRALYAMPYFGSGNVKPPAETVALLADDPRGARIASDAVVEVGRD